MRLVTRHIWRAFPELDRFSDEQCRRFTRAARRSRPFWLRLAHWTAQWGALAGCVFAAYSAADAVHQAAWRSDLSLGVTYFWIAVSGVVFLLIAAWGAPAWLLVSHGFLRRRIAWVLRARGRCSGCRYVLVGLPVGPGNLVVCPECGLEASVDPSLGELTTGSDGRDRYTPSATVLKAAEPWVNLKRVKWWAARVSMVAVLLVLIAGIGFGLREWRLRAQAARARALPAGVEEMRSLITRHRLPAVAEGDAGFTAAERLAAMRKKAGVVQAAAFPAGLPAGAWLDARAAFPESPLPWADSAESRSCSERLLAAMESAGLFADLRAVAAAGALFDDENEGLRSRQNRAELASLYEFAQWAMARARAARASGNLERFEESLTTNIAIAAMLERGWSRDARQAGLAIESETLAIARAALA
ncbi:MAG TPA: hypothetical protein VFF65_03355, partial [Phycisphaerales bacterium]|nr:hypothetical protein [Phycisphaerales bacterium]